jgi:transcriptional regulator with XRE-family HTH domain
MLAKKINRSGHLISRLNERRVILGMTYRIVAARSGVPMRTVQRVFSGQERAASFANVYAIADAMDAPLTTNPRDINHSMLAQAKSKAGRLVAMLQGTSALEAQAIDEKAKRNAKQIAVRDLLACGRTRLWE